MRNVLAIWRFDEFVKIRRIVPGSSRIGFHEVYTNIGCISIAHELIAYKPITALKKKIKNLPTQKYDWQ